MKLSLPTEDTLLSVSALAAGGLAAQARAWRAASSSVPSLWHCASPETSDSSFASRAKFVLAPRATHDALFTQSIAWSNSMDVPWQAAGVALGGHALKDLTVAARSPKTTAESRGACQTAGWTWLCGSALSIGNALAKKGSAKEDASYAGAAVMGALAATLLAQGYGLDEQAF